MQKIYKIDNEIYLEDRIKETISDFSEIAKISYEENQLEITGDNEVEIEEIFNEFMNYLISNINENN